MLLALFNVFKDAVQMVGIGILLIGALYFAAAIFRGSVSGFVKSGALMIIGGYLAGFTASFHP